MCKFIAVAGLGYGDEGKGSIVDFLCRHYDASAVVRYNGGPQAAHHVVRSNGQFHCFSQFGAGTFVPGVRTHLSRQMLVKPSNLLVERDVLSSRGQTDALQRLSIDPAACLVTPWHALLCQLEEVARGENRFGSVGMGVGQAASDRRDGVNVLTLSDFLEPAVLRGELEKHYAAKMERAREIVGSGTAGGLGRAIYEAHCRENPPGRIAAFYEDFGRRYGDRLIPDKAFLGRCAEEDRAVILEGAQGMLLDVRNGFFPYITKTDVSFRGAAQMLEAGGGKTGDVTTIGVLRAYSTRHGPGPFVTLDPLLSATLLESHNRTNPWQGEFRVGWFDLVAARYSLQICGGADCLAITCLDRLSGLSPVKICTAYELEGEAENVHDFFDYERLSGRTIIHAIKPQGTEEMRRRLSRLLFRCKPLCFREFKGWEIKKRTASFEDIPSGLRDFVDFLESAEGLSKQIAFLSLGPTAQGKVVTPAAPARSIERTPHSTSTLPFRTVKMSTGS